MKNILKDLKTANYNPKTNKINSMYQTRKNKFHRIIYLHECGHRLWHKKGYNNITYAVISVWLWITILYPTLLFIEEVYCWIFAFKYKQNMRGKKT